MDASDSSGKTALHAAAANGQEKLVGVLIAAEANSNALDAHAWTPLHLAARNGHADCVRPLVAAGVNLKYVLFSSCFFVMVFFIIIVVVFGMGMQIACVCW